MAQKAGFQTFTQQWNKTVNWAKQNNIPYSAYYPVYQLDSQRLLSGSPMSESERVRAIQAAAGLNYSTALPTDNPSWTDFRGNTVRNAQQIFTGLNPIHLFGNIMDTVKNTVEHPSNLIGAAEDVGKIINPLDNHQQTVNAIHGLSGKVLEPNSILSWIPGAYDVAQVEQKGGGGLENLAKDPLTSLLDIIPFGRAASELTVRGAVADVLERRTGLTAAELRKAGIWRVGGKTIKSATADDLSKIGLGAVGKKISANAHPWIVSHFDPDTGAKVNTDISTQPTLGDRWDYYKTKIGAGSEQARIIEERLKANRIGTRIVENIAKPALEKLSKLTDEQKNALVLWSRTDFRSLEEKMADETVPLALREAYQSAYGWSQTLNDLRLASGEMVAFQTPWTNPDGSPIMESYLRTSPQYRSVRNARDAAEKAQTELDKQGRWVDLALYTIDEQDTQMLDAFNTLDQMRQMVQTQWQHAAPNQNPGLRSMLGLPREVDAYTRKHIPELDVNVTRHHTNAIRDLIAPGGLLDQANKAYRDEDWQKLVKVLRAAKRKWGNDSFKDIPTDGAAVLSKMKNATDQMLTYAVERNKLAQKIEEKMTGYINGRRTKNYANSIGVLSKRAHDTHQAFIKTAIENPPDMWRNFAMDLQTADLTQREKTAAAIENTKEELTKQGWEDSDLTHMHQDPRVLLELMTNANKSALENDMLPDIDHAESIAAMQSGYDYIASLRARGQQPLWVHMLSPEEAASKERTYDVYIHGVNPRTPSGSKAAKWGYTPSVYDIGAGLLEDTKQIVERDMMEHFINQELMPQLHDASTIHSIIRNYYKSEFDLLAQHSQTGEVVGHPLEPRTVTINTETALGVIKRGLNDLNLEEFKPSAFFGEGFTHPTLNATYYIDKNMSASFKQTIDKFQFPANNIVDRGTKLFRFSILGLSPRYTAHILFGGSFMLGLRSNPGMFRYMGDAFYFALHGSFSEKTYARFHPDFVAEMQKQGIESELAGTSTEEGLAAAQYHYITMNSAGRNWLIPEWLSRHQLPDEYKTRVRAAADLNFKFTRAIRRAQNAVVFLDGASRALKDGSKFYQDRWIPRESVNQDAHWTQQVDAQGRNVYHPSTMKVIHDKVRDEVPMTPQQAHKAGMDAVAEVMGNLRHMTPLERNLLARVFPFYGWTKHVLQYVLSYPFDHPYRAFIVSQLAMQNSEDVASGLPLRIELLTFLGTPDQYGNVTAIDTKALNPFRDTANYASLTGLFESLNPAILGLGSIVDPQLSFAGQNVYPQVTFNSLYGTATAGAGGNLYTAAEQFVPQLSAVDAAFNLSGQYAYLKRSNPQAFSKKVFESLGLPFTPEQLNLRQIAAKEEIARYKIASQAGYEVASGSDPNALAGYPSTANIPDPLNTLYNVTPAYLAAMQQQSEAESGLPYSETGTAPRTPAGL